MIQNAASPWTENITADGVTGFTNDRVDPDQGEIAGLLAVMQAQMDVEDARAAVHWRRYSGEQELRTTRFFRRRTACLSQSRCH